MHNKKLSIALLLGTLLSSPAFARDPYIVDDAGIADKGTVNSTNWLSHSNEGENIANVALAYQAFTNLETTVQATRDVGDGNNDTQFTLQEKYQWHNAPAWQSSFTGGVTYDTIQQELSGVYAYIPVTYVVTPILSLNFNAGWEYSHPTEQTSASWGVNAALQATKTISFTAEEFGRTTGKPGQQAGIGWQPAGQTFFMGDLVYGHDINGTTGQWVTTGLSFTF